MNLRFSPQECVALDAKMAALDESQKQRKLADEAAMAQGKGSAGIDSATIALTAIIATS